MLALPHLRNQPPEALSHLFPDLEIEAGLARRIVSRLVHQDRDDLEGVPGISRRILDVLTRRARRTRLELLERTESAVDPFVKYLFRAPDGARIETVRIPLEQPRFSVCVSSQAGCAFACVFCATGRLGLERSLEPWEIVEQVLAVRQTSPERPVTGVVFQGQGEPFHNYDAVMTAAAILRHPAGGRIGADRITISTVGIPAMIDRYAAEGHPYRLILSLPSAFAAKRSELLPVAGRYPLGQVAEAMLRLARSRGTPVHVGWVLIAGVNTDPEEARELRRLFAGARLRVSVIDVNPIDARFARASDPERAAFLNALSEQGIAFVRRYSGGPDIRAACGMLAASRPAGPTLPGSAPRPPTRGGSGTPPSPRAG